MAKIRQALAIWLTVLIAPGTLWMEGCKKDDQAKPAAAVQGQAPATTSARPSADELYQLVAPIALFPDNLVAQVLAGSTYPDQIQAAENWMKQNSSLKGDALMQAANEQPWDVSVKALTQFPDVLGQMASNLSWTSALGDAYFNIPQDVMNAVQTMRQRASQAGNLKSSPQQTVTTEAAPAPQPAPAGQTTIVQPPAQTIVIQPAQPQVVYVPTYNPAVVYGAPVPVYPGYVPPPPPSTGELIATGLISFGVGMAVGAAMSNSCCGWGWNSWGCGWHSSTVVYNRNVYVSNSNTFVNRNNYYNRNVNNINVNNANINRNNINRNNVNANNLRTNNFNNTNRGSSYTTPNFGSSRNQAQFQNTRANAGQPNNLGGANRAGGVGAENRPSVGAQGRPPAGQQQARPQAAQSANRPDLGSQQRDNARGYGQSQQARGTNSGAFSNYNQGGNTRVNSARGEQSMSGNRAGGSSGGARAGGGRAGGAHRRN